MRLKIGVIGAGISAAVFSRLIKDVALVEVFEKSRGTGGRLSRHAAEGFNFDLGCQDIILPPGFQSRIITKAITESALVPWQPTFHIVNQDFQEKRNINLENVACYCGNGNMNQFVKWAFHNTKINFQEKIIETTYKDNSWFLLSDSGRQYGPFDIVVMSCPAPQVMMLTAHFNDELHKVAYDSCLVINVGLKKGLSQKIPAVIKSEKTLVSWLIQSHLKPNARSNPGVTIQSKPLAYCDLLKHKERLSMEMMKESFEILDIDDEVAYKKTHIWRYSRCIRPLNLSLLYKNQMGVIGDCLKVNSKQSNIVSCIESAVRLSQHIKSTL